MENRSFGERYYASKSVLSHGILRKKRSILFLRSTGAQETALYVYTCIYTYYAILAIYYYIPGILRLYYRYFDFFFKERRKIFR
jgi:hypothetical protein